MAETNINDVISDYAATGQTGTVMVVFEDNSMGRFYVVGGVLATARYRSKEGNEAVREADGKSIANVRFHENADLVRSGKLIDARAATRSTVASVTQAPVVSDTPRTTSRGGPRMSHITRTGIQELLTDYMGPVASVMMDDVPASADLETALDLLSREISDTAEAKRFVQAARRLARDDTR